MAGAVTTVLSACAVGWFVLGLVLGRYGFGR